MLFLMLRGDCCEEIYLNNTFEFDVLPAGGAGPGCREHGVSKSEPLSSGLFCSVAEIRNLHLWVSETYPSVPRAPYL